MEGREWLRKDFVEQEIIERLLQREEEYKEIIINQTKKHKE